jgi:hypothetical protein
MKFRQQRYAASLASCCSNSKNFFNTHDEETLLQQFFFSIYLMKTWGEIMNSVPWNYKREECCQLLLDILTCLLCYGGLAP